MMSHPSRRRPPSAPQLPAVIGNPISTELALPDDLIAKAKNKAMKRWEAHLEEMHPGIIKEMLETGICLAASADVVRAKPMKGQRAYWAGSHTLPSPHAVIHPSRRRPASA